MRILRLAFLAFLLFALNEPAEANEGLRVATFSVDITPPLGQPVGQGFIPILETAEHPLLARGIIFKDEGQSCVICTLDLMEVHNDSYDFLRQAIGEAAGVPQSHVALQALHQHTAPAIDMAAQRFEFKDDNPRRVATSDYLVDVAKKLTAAIRDSRKHWQRVTHIGTGKAKVERVASNRRLHHEDGSIHARSSNTKSSPALRELPEGLIDPWVRTVSLHDGERPVAQMYYYASHPQSFYGDGRASYDVPGIIRERLEKETGAFQLYLTGCGGDIAFGKYNDGSRQARAELTERLQSGIEQSIANIKRTRVDPINWSIAPITFPPRTDEAFGEAENRRILDDPKSNASQRRKAAIALAWIERLKAKPAKPVELSCLSIGRVKMLHLPGEPFVQFQLAAQKMRRDRFVCVAGYGDCGMGYIGGDRIHTDRGGYEQTYAFAGPCEELFLSTIKRLLTSDSVAKFDGEQSKWNGLDRYDFTVDGRKCWVVVPKSVAEGRPWIWRARFFGHEPQADIALLNEGFHLAYCDVGGLFGNPQSVQHWNAFYRVMTEQHRLSKRPALEGTSRGGLSIYNWAAANPDKLACIYGDAPVCDFKSWPGGKGKGQGGGAAWQQCLDAYGLTEAEGLEYKNNPIDNLKPLADAGVPLLHIVGDADVVVPVEENTAIVERRYKELGGSIQVIHKPGVGHHPHSLKDPGPIVAFVLKHTRPNVRLRGGLNNSRLRFENEKRGHVAFIGGSITEMNGYRPMVCRSLQKRFPETDFTFTAAGISSTCSTTGAFRLSDDVLSKGPVDLFFVEFAVNDDQDAGRARRECIRGMEGIVRQARRHNPNVDIVITHFVNPGMLEQLQAGNTPLSMRAHSDVARHYNVPTIHLAKEVAEQINAGKLTWQQFGGTHPKPFGNRICADMIDQLLDEAWGAALASDAKPMPHGRPDQPLDPLHYGNGRFVDLARATVGSGWEIKNPDWQAIQGSKRSRFTNIPMLCAEQSGATLTLKFTGTAVGAYVVAGPDAAILEARVDEGEIQRMSLYHRFSKGLHYPRTVMFATDLPAGEHVLTLRIANDSESDGHAARIIKFVAN